MLNKIDYKGKYFILQDQDIPLTDDYYLIDDFVIGTISKEDALEKGFVLAHRDACTYYGIPPYHGSDKELRKVYK